MKTLHYEINIEASAEKTWNTMLDDATFRQWTSAFMEGSSFEGAWQEGSKMLFLGPDRSGMVSEIAEVRPHEFVSIKHIGIVSKGVEDTTSEEARKWTPAYENYTFIESGGQTTVKVDMDSLQENQKMFDDAWPKALNKLKELAEK